jgi:periplasmic divalent cation tolerance protein
MTDNIAMTEANISQPEQLGVVLVTAGSEAEAEQLAQLLVENRLAACVSLSPIRSIYTWQGKVQNEQEWQLLIKTDLGQMDAISQLITQHHSYDVPEIIALPIQAGLTSYLNWMTEQTNSYQ